MINWIKAKLKKILITLGILGIASAAVLLQPDALLSVQVNNELIEFHYTDENSNENLIIYTNSEEYVSGDDIYIAVKNESGKSQIANVSLFLEEGGITELQKLYKNTSYEVTVDDYEMEQFDCSYIDSTVASSTKDSTKETIQKKIEQTCERRKKIGSHQETKYKDIWRNVDLEDFVKYDYYRFIEINEVPEKNKKGFQAKKKSDIVILKGETVYLKAKVKAPLWGNESNEFFVEIIGDSSYGNLDPFLATYTTRRKLSIDNTKIDDDLTDFPVAVIFDSGNFDFSKANTDGFDIRFTASDGDTLLKYERERHDDANDLAEYHVKVPTVASSTDTDFYAYYKTDDTADGADPTNVWDSNFNGVWHMQDETTATTTDSTSNDNDGTKGSANNPIEIAGKIGKAQDFSTDTITLDVSKMPQGNTDFTMSAWIYTQTANGVVLGWGTTGSASSHLHLQLISTTQISMSAWANDLWADTTNYVDSWMYVTFTHTSSSVSTIYIDGASVKSEGSRTYSIGNTVYTQGERGDSSGYFDGYLDEVRVSDTPRTAAWVNASYNSTNDSLLTYGDEEEDAGRRRIILIE